jgi:divalent metal cation (Fe/Co/Zn/Cd) transporter
MDAIFAIGIAFYIFWSAISIVRGAIVVLMDEELPGETTQHMYALATSVPGVLGAHDLRTRISGTHWFVQLHLELPGEMSLSQAHAHCVEVEKAIHAHYPRAEVLVHADPPEVVQH